MDFNRYISTGEFAALADWFRSEGEVVHYAAGDRFARQGCRNRHCGVVGRGAFRYVHLARSGERHVVGYAFAGEFVGDYVAMCDDRPSQVSIEARCGVRTTIGSKLFTGPVRRANGWHAGWPNV